MPTVEAISCSLVIAFGMSFGLVASATEPPPGDEPPKRVVIETHCPEIRIAIQFDDGSWEVPGDAEAILDEVAAVLADHPEIVLLEIQGHTAPDEERYSIKVSERRANAVRDALIERGVDPERLVAVGYGETRPWNPNETEEERARNRRVEFEIREPAPDSGD